MTDHERIYLEPPSDESDVRDIGRCWCCDQIDDDWTEYVRADLVAFPASDYVAVKREDLRLYMAGEPHVSSSPSYPARHRKFINARDRLINALKEAE